MKFKNKRTPTIKEIHDTGVNISFDENAAPKESIYLQEDESIEVFNVSKDSAGNINCIPITIDYNSK